MGKNKRKVQGPKGGASAVGCAKGPGRTTRKYHCFWVVFVSLGTGRAGRVGTSMYSYDPHFLLTWPS